MIKVPENLSPEEREYLDAVFALVGTSPKLEAIWTLMDLAWHETSCNHNDLRDACLSDFYNHPVWLLNGLFVEQHSDSITHREKFTQEVLKYQPGRVCDYGGGYGSLARMIAKSSNSISVDLYDPHPHQSSLELSSQIQNISHVSQLSGDYDVMLATDVFEHVVDPLLEVETTARHLKTGGRYLIANCFYPVIECHLPSTFHFRDSFSAILAEMNLKPVWNVVYGTVFEKTGEVKVSQRIRRLEKKSRVKFAFNHWLSSSRELRQQWLDRGTA